MINKIWQTPGNSRAFDCSFEEVSTNERGYISRRSMFILNYLYNKAFHGKAMNEIQQELKEQLRKNFKEFKENNSIVTHFVKPLIFYGLVTKGTFENIVEWRISTFGRRFVEAYRTNQFDKCKMLYVQAIMSAKYPNNVTPVSLSKSTSAQFFYYLLKKRGKLSKEEIINGLVYINTYDDLKNFELFFQNNLIETDSKKSEKFWSWKIKEWQAMKLIEISKENIVSINLKYQNFFENYLFTNIEEAFISHIDVRFQNNLVLNKNKINQKRSKELREMTYKRDNWNCVVNSEHQSFLKKNEEKT